MKIHFEKLISIIAIFIAACSLLVSVRNCTIAEEREAAALRRFIQVNRPYISIEPVKFEDKDVYIFTENNKGKIQIFSRWRIKNIGTTGANNIRVNTMIDNKQITLDIKSWLNPGESVIAESMIFFLLSGQKDWPEELINNLGMIGAEVGVEIKWSVEYASEIDETIVYETVGGGTFYKDRVLLKSIEYNPSNI